MLKLNTTHVPKFLSLKSQVLFRHRYLRGWMHSKIHWMNEAPSTTQFDFGRAYQQVPDFPLLWFYWYPPFIEMLHKQFEVLGYKKVHHIKGTLSLASIIVKRTENSQKPSYAFTTLIIIKNNDLGNSWCLAGSGAFPNSSCNRASLTSIKSHLPSQLTQVSKRNKIGWLIFCISQ